MSVKREVSEKNRKFISKLEQTKVSCEDASNIRSKRVFILRGNTAPNKRKYTGKPRKL